MIAMRCMPCKHACRRHDSFGQLTAIGGMTLLMLGCTSTELTSVMSKFMAFRAYQVLMVS